MCLFNKNTGNYSNYNEKHLLSHTCIYSLLSLLNDQQYCGHCIYIDCYFHCVKLMLVTLCDVFSTEIILVYQTTRVEWIVNKICKLNMAKHIKYSSRIFLSG